MTALEALRMAVQGLISNRLRTLLTMLGITIGVASVIVLVAVGHGSAVKVNSQIESLGTNTLTVMGGGGFGFGRRGGPAATSQQLTLKDVAKLEDKQQAPDILTVAPVVNADSATALLQRHELHAEPVRGHDAVVCLGARRAHRDRHVLQRSGRDRPAALRRRRADRRDEPLRRPESGRPDGQGQRRLLPGLRRAPEQGHERHPGSGRHRDRAALDHAQPAHRHDGRPQPDRHPGALEWGGRCRGRRDRRDSRADAHEQRQRDLPGAQPGLAARDHAMRPTTSSPCCSRPWRRSRCWWAASAS